MTERELIDDILYRIEADQHGIIDWIDTVGRARLAAPLEAANARIRELEAELTRLRQIEADAKAANLIGPDGKVRRVLGTLPITADGCIASTGAVVWDRLAGLAYYDLKLASPHRASYCVPSISYCYSTPEAVETAKEETNG